jgi:L-fuconolactonase
MLRLGADVRSPDDDPWAIWRTADRLGLAVSCFLRDAEPAHVEALAIAMPRLPIVIEHFTGTASTGGPRESHRQALLALARFPNILVKVTGLGEFVPRPGWGQTQQPFRANLAPHLDDAYSTFGPERMLRGSDYPPVAGREGYTNALRLCQEQFADRSAADRTRIFGDVAQSVFSRSRPPTASIIAS